ncbi:hypothetical protein [Halorubrum sp. DTA46]|uniref:hypothetical protein n=1 Tax=Halorubrum sp. DTA46 TaxID=3402162 RepID=UPI003AAFAFA3
MQRRSLITALTALATTGLAGCSRTLPAEQADVAVAERFDGEVDRPQCTVESETVEVTVGDETREYETAATIPYPDAPSGFRENDVIEWVAAFEEAYLTHRILCDRGGSGHILRIGYTTDRIELLERAGDGWVVFLRYSGGATAGAGDGGMWEADVGYSAVAYALDETGAARVALDEPVNPDSDDIESAVPDPVDEGDLVAVFE